MSITVPGPLRNPQFRRLWAGQALSSLGDGIFPVALATLLLASGQQVTLGLVLGVESLALGITTLTGGVLADRIRRSTSMALADVVRLMATLGFALGAATHEPALYVLAAAMGAGAAFFRPAYGAILPTLVESADLEIANAVQSTTNRLALILGPAVGGVIVSLAGTRAAFWLDAATFLLSIVTLIGLREPPPEREAAEGFLTEVRQGWQAVFARRWILAIIVQGTVQLVLVLAPALILLPIALADRRQLDALGHVLALQAVGALVGGILASRLRTSQPGTVAVVALALVGVQLLSLALSWPLWAVMAGSVLTGLGYAAFGVLWFSSLQRQVPGKVLGRVLSIEMLGTYALEPVGLAVAPLLVHRLGLARVITGALVALVLTTVLPLLLADVRTFGSTTALARDESPEQSS